MSAKCQKRAFYLVRPTWCAAQCRNLPSPKVSMSGATASTTVNVGHKCPLSAKGGHKCIERLSGLHGPVPEKLHWILV